MITSSFIASKLLELEIDIVNAKKEGNRFGFEYLKIFVNQLCIFACKLLLLL